MPWEGFNVNINGSKGRIEYNVVEQSYINSGGDPNQEGATKGKKITVYPMFDAPYIVPIEDAAGGHGGGDRVMLDDIFGSPAPDRFSRAAGAEDGAASILTGIAANKSIAGGMPVQIKDLLIL
jgi:hypothetical protein